MPRGSVSRTARLASLPLGAAGRATLGLGKRLSGQSADAVSAELQQRTAAPLVFEMLHFCLTAGFEGRYEGNTARLREYKTRLAARIPKPEAMPPPPPAAVLAPLVHAFPWRYYAVSSVLVVTVPVLLWWLSR